MKFIETYDSTMRQSIIVMLIIGFLLSCISGYTNPILYPISIILVSYVGLFIYVVYSVFLLKKARSQSKELSVYGYVWRTLLMHPILGVIFGGIPALFIFKGIPLPSVKYTLFLNFMAIISLPLAIRIFISAKKR